MQLRIIQRDAAGNASEATRPMSLAERIDFMTLMAAGAESKEAAQVLDLSGKGMVFRAVSAAPAVKHASPTPSPRSPARPAPTPRRAAAQTLLRNATEAAERAAADFQRESRDAEQHTGRSPAFNSTSGRGLLSGALEAAERARHAGGDE